MNYCKNCGATIEDGALSCVYCGTKININNSNVERCHKCGKEIKPGALFCPNCGAKKEELANDNSSNLTDTGYILGIISIICAFFFPFIGLLLGAIGMFNSKTSAGKNISKIGFYLSLVFVIFIFVFFLLIIAVASNY